MVGFLVTQIDGFWVGAPVHMKLQYPSLQRHHPGSQTHFCGADKFCQSVSCIILQSVEFTLTDLRIHNSPNVHSGKILGLVPCISKVSVLVLRKRVLTTCQMSSHTFIVQIFIIQLLQKLGCCWRQDPKQRVCFEQEPWDHQVLADEINRQEL